MPKFARIAIVASSLLACVVATAAGAAETSAGIVQQLRGDVTITNANNESRRAATKENIQSGDTLSTDAKSEILLRMSDGSSIALRPNTQFKITEFKFDKRPSDSSLVSLLRGTARMVTGLIGRNSPTNVRVTTPIATIGIRGTDFEVAFVPEDTADTRAGVYDYVRDGVTNIQIASGQNMNVAKEQTAFAPDKPRPGEEPLQLLRERPIFLQQGGGLDALIQSITIQVPTIAPVFR